jgi:hypothetical protein
MLDYYIVHCFIRLNILLNNIYIFLDKSDIRNLTELLNFAIYQYPNVLSFYVFIHQLVFLFVNPYLPSSICLFDFLFTHLSFYQSVHYSAIYLLNHRFVCLSLFIYPHIQMSIVSDPQVKQSC